MSERGSKGWDEWWAEYQDGLPGDITAVSREGIAKAAWAAGFVNGMIFERDHGMHNYE